MVVSMKYSVCIDAVYMGKGLFTEGMRLAKECGYTAIEFWSWWDKDIKAIAEAKDQLEMEVAAFCTKHANPGNKDEKQKYLEGLHESIETAKLLGCKTLISQAGNETEGISREQHRESLIDTMKASAPIAKKAGVILVLEPLNILVDHAGYHLTASKDAFDIVKQVSSENVKVLFDIYHQQITEGNIISNITHNIDKIGHFHAAGNPGRTDLTKGEINYPKVLEVIKNTGYSGYLGLEYITHTDPKQSLIETRKILI